MKSSSSSPHATRPIAVEAFYSTTPTTAAAAASDTNPTASTTTQIAPTTTATADEDYFIPRLGSNTRCSSSSSSSIETQSLLDVFPVRRSVTFRPKRSRADNVDTNVAPIDAQLSLGILPGSSPPPSVECLTDPHYLASSPQPTSTTTSGACYDAPSPLNAAQSAERRERKAQERKDRHLARLTSHKLLDLVSAQPSKMDATDSMYDYTALDDFVQAINGNFCQFTTKEKPKEDRLDPMFPPSSSTQDCCQTFSTLSAVIWGSMEFSCHLRSAWRRSSTHYLLVVAAWLHHYTKTLWASKGIRPTASDLNACLLLEKHFPVYPTGEFTTFFFNQGKQMRHELELLITAPKRAKSRHTCGYTIVSGDFTVAVVALREGCLDRNKGPPYDTYTLVLADSHGTLPWAKDRVSFTSVSIANTPSVRTNNGGVANDGAKPKWLYKLENGQAVYDLDTGLDHFCEILFALLEEHREYQFQTMKAALMKQQQEQDTQGDDTTSPSQATNGPPAANEDSHVVDEVAKREIRGNHGEQRRSVLDELFSSASRKRASSARRAVVPVQYLTWSPLVRKHPGSGLDHKEICRRMVKEWLPEVVQQEGMPERSQKWLENHTCFFGSGAKDAPNSVKSGFQK